MCFYEDGGFVDLMMMMRKRGYFSRKLLTNATFFIPSDLFIDEPELVESSQVIERSDGNFLSFIKWH